MSQELALINDHHYMDRLPALAARFARSNLCPETFRGKPDDVALIGYTLADLGLRLTLQTLPRCYVVHGRVGIDSQLQATLAARAGYTVRPIMSQCDESSATVEIITPQGTRHEVTFTMAEAERAKLTEDKKTKTGSVIQSMYKVWPVNMLVARAMTRAIKWHAPEVMLGLEGTANFAEENAHIEGDGGGGEPDGTPPAPVLSEDEDIVEAELVDEETGEVLDDERPFE